ncbi:hypothetical protein [Neisseria cinerea]|uniref:hypothetical protein n=1 Tax=Neisseria cinerea TaxID=483 RepID=UPI0028D65879|nr:hypothetical protein [Neisseria cinerea]
MPDNLILISVLAKPSPTHARKTLIGGYHIAAFQTNLDGRIGRIRADLPYLISKSPFPVKAVFE